MPKHNYSATASSPKWDGLINAMHNACTATLRSSSVVDLSSPGGLQVVCPLNPAQLWLKSTRN